MSAIGPKQACASAPHMSAFGEKADIELNIMRDILKVIFWQASAGARHFRHKSTRQLVPRGVGVRPQWCNPRQC